MRNLATASFAALLCLLPLAPATASEPVPEPALDVSATDASATDASAIDVSTIDASATDASAIDAGATESRVVEPSEAGGDEVEGDPSEAPRKRKRSTKPKTKRPRGDEACDFRTPIHTHVVEPGEHLGRIAGRYGVLSKDLVALNPELSANPDLLRVGQKLRVCPEIPPQEIIVQEHVVQTGETFNAIALSYGLSPSELLEQQDSGLANPSKLRVGHKLKVITVGEILPGFEPEEPQPGQLGKGRQLPESDKYVIKRTHNAWGTPRTIKLISQALDRYHRNAKGGPKIRIGDISREQGGPLTGHLSHQEGRDVDIGIVLQGKLADRLHFSGATRETIDVERTWLLVESFLATGEVRFIFLDYGVQELLYEYAKEHGVSEAKLDEYFQYPRGSGRNHGIIRHWRGHKNHIHVRFRD